MNSVAKSMVRLVVPMGCIAAIGVIGCNRDRIDRDRDRPLDRPGVSQSEHPNDGVGTTTVTGATVTVGNQTAISRIVAERCARESACNSIGPDKHYANSSACSQKLSADMADDLNVKDCPYGVDQKELNECLQSIRTEDCNNPIDAISRLAACRTGDMCMKTAAPNR